MSENIGEVAAVIYRAATDGTTELRYPAGQDAVELLKARPQMDDAAFIAMMSAQTGI